MVLTDNTGMYDNWRRDREETSLLNTLGLCKEEIKGLYSGEFGKGRLVYIPELRSEKVCEPEKLLFTAFGQNQPLLDSSYLRSPLNLQSIIDAIWWASGDTIPVEIKAPEYVVIDLQRKGNSNIFYLHMINYKPDSEVKDIRIRLNEKVFGECEAAKVLSPETSEEYSLKPDINGWITIPELLCYLVVEIDMNM